jgi:hypothetical protein
VIASPNLSAPREPDIPLPRVAAALRKVTEFLAHELASPRGAAPRLSSFEWIIAEAVSAMQGISPAFHGRLNWRGPPSWEHFLEEQRTQCLARHRLIERLLGDLDTMARSTGTPFVPLKGAALYGLGIYRAGERPMGDVDLLVHEGGLKSIAGALEKCGYVHTSTTWRHQVFKPVRTSVPQRVLPGEHIDNPIRVEVHTQIAERLPLAETDITQLMLDEPHPGQNAYPSRARLMMHLLLHASGNMRARALRFIQLHDIALLAQTLDAADLRELADRLEQCEGAWWAAAPLVLTSGYYPKALPAEIWEPLYERCPPLLRKAVRRQRITDVSWSNIYVQAFPGLEWSRSLGEAIGYVRTRVWPNSSALAELKQGSAEIIGAESVPWYALSHAQRILRWAFSRPPRVQTLLCVRAALRSHARGL